MEIIARSIKENHDLSKAQIVLITDGESEIDEDYVLRVWDSIEIPIGINIITLGDENEKLKSIIEHQHKKGIKAFYQHITDSKLSEICEGKFVPRNNFDITYIEPSKKQELLEMLSKLQESELELMSDVEKDRFYRKDKNIEEYFEKYFSKYEKNNNIMPLKKTEDYKLLETIGIIIWTISDMIIFIGNNEIDRKISSVEILENTLEHYDIEIDDYHRIMATYPQFLEKELDKFFDCVKHGYGVKFLGMESTKGS